MRASIGPFTFSYKYCNDSQTQSVSLEKLSSSATSILGLDIETAKILEFRENPKAGLDPRLSKIRLVQIYDGSTVYIFDMFTMSAANLVSLSILLNNRTLIAHNACFEIKHLKRLLNVQLNIECSLLLGMLVDRAEKSPFEPDSDEAEEDLHYSYKVSRGYSLQALTYKYFNFKIDKAMQVSDWSVEELTEQQLAYAALDAVLTFELGKRMYKQVSQYRMARVYKLLRSMQHVITDMELNGFGFDRTTHGELCIEWLGKMQATLATCEKHFLGVNLNSTKQLSVHVEKTFPANLVKSWPCTETGCRSFSKNTLLGLPKSEAIDSLLDYRHWAKLVSTYGEALAAKIHPITGRIHGDFFLGETRTGRLSARNPNLQNMPRGGEMRKLFTAREGCSLVVADFSQIEMRVAAEVSRDPTMLKAFKDGLDLHKYIVMAVARKPYKAVTDEERQLGKAVNFGLLFGMGAKKLQLYAKLNYGVTMSPEKAEEAWSVFHKVMYPTYSAWCTRQRDTAIKLGYTRTPMGKMRRVLEDEVYTKAVNTPVQGGAAEVAYCALVNLRSSLSESGLTEILIVNMIHDEIILDCPQGLEDVAGGLLISSMTKGMLDVFPGAEVTGLADASYGTTWFNAKDKKSKKLCQSPSSVVSTPALLVDSLF